MSDCLVGCMQSYVCGNLMQTPDFVSMAPYVMVGFDSPDNFITVGNKSYPARPNEAIIKSFEYGSSNGKQITIEVFDEQGGAFTKFWDEMPKKLDDLSGQPKIKAQWGWVGTDCNAPMPIQSSPIIECLCTHVETSVSEGKIKFVVTGTDTMQYIFNTRLSDSYGGDKTQKLSLKDAIRRLFTEKEPKCDVQFLQKSNNGGQPTEWQFGGAGIPPDGPVDRWSSDNQNKLATAMEWLEPFHTQANKGIVPVMDKETNTLIFWEDFENCNAGGDACMDTVGTFIVNGGRCSPVIEFSPKINWMVQYNKSASGGGEGPASHAPVKKTNQIPGCPSENEDQNTGPMQSVLLTAQAVNAYGPDKALEQTSIAQSRHIKANAIYAKQEAINADLKFVGNPARQFCGVKEVIAKWASIVVINPFHLGGGGGGDCPDWLAEPGCNTYLSNKQWKIMGFSHNITEGSYTTTLSVQLVANALSQ